MLFVRGGTAALDGITPALVALGAIKSAIVATSWIFAFTALRTLPISLATPIRTSTPALVLVAAFFVYGEVPSMVQAFGMLVVMLGCMAISWAGRHEGIDFFRDRAVWCAVASTFCSMLSALWDKYLFQVRHVPVESMQLLYQTGLVAFYGGAMVVQRAFGWKRNSFEWRWTIPLVGVSLIFSDWFYFNGIAVDGVLISVGMLIRRFSVVITFAVGAMVFRETNLLRKSLALLAMLAGIVLLCLG